MKNLLIVLLLTVFSFSLIAEEKKEQVEQKKPKTEKVEKKKTATTKKVTETKKAEKTESGKKETPENKTGETKEVKKTEPEKKIETAEPSREEKKAEPEKKETAETEEVVPEKIAETEKKPEALKEVEKAEPVKEIAETPEKDIKTLTKELEDLKAEVAKMKAEEKPAEKKKDEKLSGDPIMFKPYGFIELYGWANDAQFVSNDLTIYVKDEKGSTANLSARNSRLGFTITVPYITAVDLSAKLEIDFFGSLPDGSYAVTSTGIRMRHAYFKLAKTFATGTTLALLAGQTWTTAIIPIFPNLINPAAGWGIGNPWNRLPLAEITIAQKMGKVCAGIKLAAAKPISGASSNRKNFIEMNVDSGDVSNWPSLQGQLFLNGKFDKMSFNFAAAGAYGREDYTGGIKMNNSEDLVYGDEVHTWIFNTALVISHKYADIKGKFYLGENLDMYGVFGGSLIRDENDIVRDSMEAMGYWAELSLKPFAGLVLSTGLGAEMMEDSDDAKYKQNDAFWVAAYYTFFNHFRIGFQWQNTITEYEDKGKLQGNSFMGSLRFTF